MKRRVPVFLAAIGVHTYITRLAFWSFGRDNGGCPNQGFASATCSGITQNNFQFSQSFEAFK